MSRLTSLEIAGFRGFRDRAIVQLGTDFTVITGRNGSGKSTIIDAIEFAISGSLSRNADESESGETIKNYIWWRDGKPAEEHFVRLRVTPDGEGSQEALRQPSSPPDPQLMDLLIDEPLAPPDALNTFLLTTIIRDETIARLSMDLNEARRFDFIKRAIGLGESLDLERIVHALQRECENRADRIEVEYSSCRDRLTLLTTERGEAQAATSEVSFRSLDELRSAMTDYVNEPATSLGQLIAQGREALHRSRQFIDASSRLGDLRRDIANQRDSYQQAVKDVDISVLSERIQEKQRLLESWRTEILQLSTSISNSQADNPIVALRAELIDAGSKIGLEDGHCPLCGSTVSRASFDEHIQRNRKTLGDRASKTADLKHEKSKRESILSAAIEDLAVLQYRMNSLDAMRQRITDLVLRAEAEEAQLIADNGVVSLEQGVNNATLRVQQIDKLLEEVQVSSMVDTVVRLDREIAAQQAMRDEISNRLAETRTAARFLKAIFDATRRAASEIVEDRVTSMLPLLKELYSRLRPHSAWQELDYRFRGDVKGFLSFSVGNNVNPRFVYSSGQRRALGLSFLLGAHLGRKWSKLDTLILDDPVQHIDDYRALHLVEVLASIRARGRQVICAVEDSEIADLICRRLIGTGATGRRLELAFSVESGMHIVDDRTVEPLPARVLLSAS